MLKSDRKDTSFLQMQYNDANTYHKMTDQVVSMLPATPREYIILCVGTDRSTGDSLGPLTGTLLEQNRPRHLLVYGNLKKTYPR